jgi:Subtilase family
MSENYKHLIIGRENLRNVRRSGQPPHFKKRDDLLNHGKKLRADLSHAIHYAKKQDFSEEDKYVLKLKYEGSLSFEKLENHGIEFISHEDKDVCIVFSDEDGLAKFSDHLQRLGLNDADITYKQILEAIESIEGWTVEDRKSWAIRNKGLPNTETFKLDIELWPVYASNHPERIRLCSAFERWLNDNVIRRIDRINQDSLLMYRVEVNHLQSERLLNHQDIRLVDLLPQTGINYQQLNVDIEQIPVNLPMPAENAARVCILDSGINSSHPLLKTAVAECESYIQDQDVSDNAGHGTAVAGITLYGDVEGCAGSNFGVRSSGYLVARFFIAILRQGKLVSMRKPLKKPLRRLLIILLRSVVAESLIFQSETKMLLTMGVIFVALPMCLTL